MNYGSLASPAPYSMNPTYFEADIIDDFPKANMANRLSIRMQPMGISLDEADAFILTVADSGMVAAQLGQTIVVGPATNVRSTLVLFQTCDDASVQMELDGEITFTNFGAANQTPLPANFQLNYGDRLTSTFDFMIIDRRALTLGGTGDVPATPMVGGHLSGGFDFVIHRGQPGQYL